MEYIDLGDCVSLLCAWKMSVCCWLKYMFKCWVVMLSWWVLAEYVVAVWIKWAWMFNDCVFRVGAWQMSVCCCWLKYIGMGVEWLCISNECLADDWIQMLLLIGIFRFGWLCYPVECLAKSVCWWLKYMFKCWVVMLS